MGCIPTGEQMMPSDYHLDIVVAKKGQTSKLGQQDYPWHCKLLRGQCVCVCVCVCLSVTTLAASYLVYTLKTWCR